MAKKKKNKGTKGKQAKNKGKNRDNDPKFLEREGQRFFNSGNYSGAITAWNRLLKLRGGIGNAANKNLLPMLAQANFSQAMQAPFREKGTYLFAALQHASDNPEIAMESFQYCREAGKMEDFVCFCEKMIADNRNKNQFLTISYLLGVEKNKSPDFPESLSKEQAKSLKFLTQLQQKHYSKALRSMENLPKTQHYAFIKALIQLESSDEKTAATSLKELHENTKEPILKAFSRYYQAVCALKVDDNDAAESYLLAAMENFLQFPYFTGGLRRNRIANLFSRLALIRARENNLEKAAKLWKHALEWMPGNRIISLNLERIGVLLATNYAREGHLEKALEFWMPLFKSQNNNPVISKNLAIAYQRLDNFQEAARYWEHTARLWEQQLNRSNDILHIKHRLIRSYEQIAKCYDKLGQGWNRKKNYLRIIEIDPQNYKIKSALAEYYLERRMIEEAFLLLDDLIEVEPEKAIHLTNMGLACDLSYRKNEARKWWEKALTVDPNEGTAIELLSRHYHQKAMEYFRCNKNKETLEFLEKILSLRPGQHKPLALKGAVYLRQGDDDQARKYFEQAIACDPTNPETYFHVGSILLDLDEINLAEKYFTQAKEHSSSRYPLDEIYRKIGMLYSQYDLVALPGSENYEPMFNCQEMDYCEMGAKYFEKAIDEGGYDSAVFICEYLLDINCKNLIKFSEIAHELDPSTPQPYLFQAMYHLKNKNFQKFQQVLEKARKSPNYEDNQEMQSFMARINKFGDFAKSMAFEDELN